MSLSVAECPVDFENLLLAYNLHSNQGQLKTSLHDLGFCKLFCNQHSVQIWKQCWSILNLCALFHFSCLNSSNLSFWSQNSPSHAGFISAEFALLSD